MDESRKQFQEWFKSDYHPDKTGPYIKDILLFAWEASRAAIELKAPESISTREAMEAGYSGDYAAGRDGGLDGWEKQIRAAGIKVKE